jgi:(p)ppGpp synthase/HD superfamily hydrolase
MLDLNAVRTLAETAHHDQTDKIGDPYIWHVRAVAAGLRPFGLYREMAGWLHDVVEDTGWTEEQLLENGVPDWVVRTVILVSNRPGEDYQDKMKRITGHPDAVLVKISDNAHNSRRDRADKLDPATRERLAKKYKRARETLWAAADPTAVRTILQIVNPALLFDFHQWLWKSLSEE